MANKHLFIKPAKLVYNKNVHLYIFLHNFKRAGIGSVSAISHFSVTGNEILITNSKFPMCKERSCMKSH